MRSRSTKVDLAVPGVLRASDIELTLDRIAETQQANGCIPWYPGHHADPWDHVEAAMALDLGGRHDAVEAAWEWLLRTQRPDGAFAFYYRDGAVEDPKLDANHSTYLAVGAWHHFLLTDDARFLESVWPMVDGAIEFALSLQRPGGELTWMRMPDGTEGDYALLTSSSCVHLALRCALAIAERLGLERPEWELSVGALRHAVRHRPEAFEPKDRFSMDWYYPVLGGVFTGADARARIRGEGWDRFVVPGRGVRCVADEPWVTTAETCEAVVAMHLAGLEEEAFDVFESVQYLREDDGRYWTGHNYVEDDHYPEGERTTWTAAAVLLAADVLAGNGPTGALFRGDDLPRGIDVTVEIEDPLSN
jgi:hypothetical protein